MKNLKTEFNFNFTELDEIDDIRRFMHIKQITTKYTV